MAFVRAWWPAVGIVAAIGCGSVNGVMTGTGGTGGSTTTTTSSTGGTSSTTTTTTSSTTGSGGGSGGGGFEASGYACSGKQPTLSADVVPITTANCAVAVQCHIATKTAAEVYNSYVNVPCEECSDARPFVKPGDPEHSYVINKITARNLCGGFGSMPKDSQLMVSSDIQTIYDWICAGAKDD